MKKQLSLAGFVAAAAIAAAFGTSTAPTPAMAAYCDQSSNGCEHANPGGATTGGHVAPGCNAPFTGSGAGGFGFQSGQGNNQAGGNKGEPNYNPILCGNPNDNALTRGPD